MHFQFNLFTVLKKVAKNYVYLKSGKKDLTHIYLLGKISYIKKVRKKEKGKNGWLRILDLCER